MSHDMEVAAEGVKPRGRSEGAPWLRDRMERAWLSAVTHSAMFYFERLAAGEVEGVAHLESVIDQGCVLALNHVSYLDWLVVWSWLHYRRGHDVTFIGKDALFQSPVWGSLMTQAGVVRVSDDGSRFLDKAGYRRLRDARCIGIFPEGTRSPDGRLQPAKSGVIKLALRLGRPIVPVALDGFFDAWPRGARLPRLMPDRCRILFGEPWSPTHSTRADAQASLDEATAAVMARIAALLEGGTHGR